MTMAKTTWWRVPQAERAEEFTLVDDDAVAKRRPGLRERADISIQHNEDETMSEYDSYHDASLDDQVRFLPGGRGAIVNGVPYYSHQEDSIDFPEDIVMTREQQLAAAAHDQFVALYDLAEAVESAGASVPYLPEDLGPLVAAIVAARIMGNEL